MRGIHPAAPLAAKRMPSSRDAGWAQRRSDGFSRNALSSRRLIVFAWNSAMRYSSPMPCNRSAMNASVQTSFRHLAEEILVDGDQQLLSPLSHSQSLTTSDA